MPSTTVSGVFSSWLATSMNAPLTRLASTSLAFDSWSSASERVLLDDQVVVLDRLPHDGGQEVGVEGLGEIAEDVALVDGVDDGVEIGVGREQQSGGLRADRHRLLARPRPRSSPASAGRRESRAPAGCFAGIRAPRLPAGR